MSLRLPRVFAAAALLLSLSSLVHPVFAQGTPAPTENVETEPITCYWRTSTDAIRIGEVFTVVLTCGVLDTVATTVVPDQSRLDPGVLQLQPFEVRGGTQAPDLRTPSRRFFQYEYQLRYVGEEVGRDMDLPALTLTYRVQSRVQQDSAAVESRERQYILPKHTVRVLGVVPNTARDIREAAPVTLADIDARRFRATVLRVLSGALFALAAVVALWALVRVTRSRRGREVVVVRHVSDAAILGHMARELDEVRRARAGDGWTDTLAARALAALRAAASYDVSGGVSQVPAGRDTTPLSGQFVVASGFPVRRTVLVSGSATAVGIARAREHATRISAGRAQRLASLESALSAFSAGTYGREGSVSPETLDDALSSAQQAVASLRREHSWLATRLRAIARWAGEGVKARGWARS